VPLGGNSYGEDYQPEPRHQPKVPKNEEKWPSEYTKSSPVGARPPINYTKDSPENEYADRRHAPSQPVILPPSVILSGRSNNAFIATNDDNAALDTQLGD